MPLILSPPFRVGTLLAGLVLIGATLLPGHARAAPPPLVNEWDITDAPDPPAFPIDDVYVGELGDARWIGIDNGGSKNCGRVFQTAYNPTTNRIETTDYVVFDPADPASCGPQSISYDRLTNSIVVVTSGRIYWFPDTASTRTSVPIDVPVGSFQFSSIADAPMALRAGSARAPTGSSVRIYDAVSAGGASGKGAVYAMTVGANGHLSKPALIFSFPGGAGGAQPNGSAVLGADGNLYGVTLAGGYTEGPCIPLGCGVIYRLVQPATRGGAWTEQVLYTFMASANGNDFSSPYGAPVFDAAGNLYGSASGSGSELAGGVYLLTPGATTPWALTHLHDFSLSGSGGAFPQTGVTLDASGNVYGPTLIGDEAHLGVVFELTKPEAGATGPWPESVLHTFTGGNKDGAGPSAAPTFSSDGLLFGTTFAGGLVGNKQCQADDPFYNAPGCGTVYVLTPPAAR